MAGIVPVILNKGRFAPDCVGADAPAKENELKNYLMFALLIGATASMAFGQFGVVVDPAKVDVACPDEECHVAPVFMGEGGFVGELADGFDMANFVVTCGNTTASGSAAGGSDGIVRQLFSMANGLACHDDDGSIQIHGLADGGWYWINDDMNSAVSPLIAKDALMGEEVMPTDPGGVTLMASDYGTYVKSGDRVGILPHFVPTAPPPEIPDPVEPEAAALCGPVWNADDRTFYNDTTNCMLGGGGTKIVMTGPGPNGRVTRLGGSVERNVATAGPIEVSFALWSDGSGHVTGTSGSATLVGHDITLPASLRPHFTVNPFNADFRVEVLSPPSTSMVEAGITTTNGRETVTETTNVVPGMDGDDGTADVQEMTGANDPDTPQIDNGYGMHGGAIVYCTQATMRDDKDALMLLFANAAGGDPVAVDASDAEELAGADWAGQADWVGMWNGDAARDDDFIARTKTDTTPPVSVPEVVCATTKGDPKREFGTGGIEIDSESVLCMSGTSETVRLRITAPLAEARSLNASTPPIAWAGRVGGVHVAAHTTLDVMCPGSP